LHDLTHHCITGLRSLDRSYHDGVRTFFIFGNGFIYDLENFALISFDLLLNGSSNLFGFLVVLGVGSDHAECGGQE
jgi:hypothetical protein